MMVSGRRSLPYNQQLILYHLFQGQAHPHFFFFLLFFLNLLGFDFAASFFPIAILLVFPTYPLHRPSRIDRGEPPGVAALRPWLRLAAPGCLLAGALNCRPGEDEALASPSSKRILAGRGPLGSQTIAAPEYLMASIN